MKHVLDILTGPWAIEPSRLVAIREIYDKRMRGEAVDIAAVENSLGRKLQNEPVAYTIQEGVAVLPIEGILAKRANLLTQISGGTSLELAASALQGAIADPAVHSVILAIDSPGGTVDGTQTLADQVLAARDSGKAVVALAGGSMNSAAYWIGSAAQEVFVSDATTVVGSIGVVASHTDISGAQQQSGMKTTEIYAGQYKRIASQYAPLSDAGRKTIQDQVDYLYSIFVDDVARNRAVSSAQVLRDMADGRMFIGRQAVDAGLADGISTLATLVTHLNKQHSTGQKGSTSMRQTTTAPQARQPMTRAQLDQAAQAYQAAHPGTDYISAVKACSGEETASTGQGGHLPTPHDSDRYALDQAAQAYQAAHPGTDYISAVKACSGEETASTGQGGHLPTPHDSDRYALDQAAQAYQAAHPGTDYITAVKRCQEGAV